MPDDLLGANGEGITADSLRAQQAAETQAAVDAKLTQWFGHETELGAYAIEDVLALGRHAL
ncbi:MAG: hypothetical protein JWM23_560 [Microbacteriaceae bacterium]|nr:hypothetical protein [Microbacteriaceae bacterium]